VPRCIFCCNPCSRLCAFVPPMPGRGGQPAGATHMSSRPSPKTATMPRTAGNGSLGDGHVGTKVGRKGRPRLPCRVDRERRPTRCDGSFLGLIFVCRPARPAWQQLWL